MTRKIKRATSTVINIFNEAGQPPGQKLKLDELQKFEALTYNQGRFFRLYDEQTPFISLLGCAGCGKTFIALFKAFEQVLNKGQYRRVVVVRSSVQSRDQGHLPGDIKDKMAAFEAPYKQITKELFGRGDAWHMLKSSGQVDFESTSFLRGTTYQNSVVVVDECQSMSWHEISTVITRMGNNSRLIFCGDDRQNDLIKSKMDQSGFAEFVKVAARMPSYRNIAFGVQDIVRSGLCKEFILATMEGEK